MFKNKKTIYYIILFALVFANIFLFSSVSPIHSILNLQYDEQVYNIIGKGMKYGKVPYIDLIDHKGIYLFMIYALANIISEWHHIGLFIVTLIINFVTAVYTYKSSYILSEMIYSDKNEQDIQSRDTVSLLIAFTIIFILNLAPFSTCGLDCETCIVPFLMIGFYLTLSYAFDDEKKYYPLKFIYIDGILVSIIIFIKANAAMFFLAKAIYLLIDVVKNIKEKNAIKHFIFMIVFGLLGMCIGFLPGIIYCVSTNSLNEMINQSFIVNIKYMGALLPAAKDYSDAFIRTISMFWLPSLVSIISFVILIYLSKRKNNKNFLFFYILSLAFMLYIVFAPLRPYTHYLIFLLIYFIPVLIFIYCKLLINKHFNKIIVLIIIILLNVLSYPFNLKVGFDTGRAQQMVVDEVKKVYDEISKNENVINENDKKPKLLVVGYSPYLYEAFNTFPDTPYFATPMVLMKDYTRPYEELLHVIRSRKEDIIVTDFGINMLKGNPTYKDIATEAILKNYKEVVRISQNKAIYIKRS